MSEANIDNIRRISFPFIVNENEGSDLSVYSGNADVPFAIARSFVVRAKTNIQRGAHAHMVCSQLLICLSGAVDVTLKDGRADTIERLSHPSEGLLIPPGIWAEQAYLEVNSILLVLCDHDYDAEDYIRNYSRFLSWSGND